MIGLEKQSLSSYWLPRKLKEMSRWLFLRSEISKDGGHFYGNKKLFSIQHGQSKLFSYQSYHIYCCQGPVATFEFHCLEAFGTSPN
jgi:hypothetical protein